MNIALVYESVLPARGGCETYIGALSRRLAKDGHEVHLYACRWDASALPGEMVYHQLDVPSGPRSLRPWRFGQAVEDALKNQPHDATVGFDKTWGQDILYPQGGLHAASADHNIRKHSSGALQMLASMLKKVDVASQSFRKLERKQYLTEPKPIIVVNSHMVERHFGHYYHVPKEQLRVIHSAIDPNRFPPEDRGAIRKAERELWGVTPEEPVGLFVAMNYRLKGLAPLIKSLVHVPKDQPWHIAIVGHPKFARYERLAQRLGVADRLKFLGFRADPKNAFFASDFLVHPTFYDPCSLVALEALACGLPVITSQYNGASELMQVPKSGIVIQNPHDAKELANAITKMIDPQYLAEAKPAAFAAATQWTFEQHYTALLNVMKEVAARKSQRR